MAIPADAPPPARKAIPVGPSVDEWRRMTAEERESFVARVNGALSDPRSAMSEGRPHQTAKARIVDLLGLHFKAMGRAIYIAEELSVVYPGEEGFAPDILAVLDVPQPADDARMSWVVADEGRGLDLAFEVLHAGDRRKDLVDNVARYARLGIHEYFVYDRGRQEVHGYRLPSPDARRYERVVPQAGRLSSGVLGLDLAIEGKTLRFFQGMAELFGTEDLVSRLAGMVERLEAKAEEAKAEAEEARATAERATVEATIDRMQRAVLTVLDARRIECPDEVRARVTSCDDAEMLQRWLVVAATAQAAGEIV